MKEKKVDIYDPSIDAYHAVPLDIAVKYVKEAKKLEKYLVSKGLMTDEG